MTTTTNNRINSPKINLSICGGEHDVTTLTHVKSVATPDTTYREKLSKKGNRIVSHQPIPHGDMIDLFRQELSRRQFHVQNECHNLAKEGARYFGLFQVTHGLRKKHYSAGDDKIQTLDLIEACGDGESFCRSNILKYASRYDKKGTARRDIMKILHYAVLLMHFNDKNAQSEPYPQ